VTIPCRIAFDRDLSANDVRVWLALRIHDPDDRGVADDATHAVLMDLAQLSQATVRASLRALERGGYIIVQPRRGLVPRYFLVSFDLSKVIDRFVDSVDRRKP
jgi:hypothetical protein